MPKIVFDNVKIADLSNLECSLGGFRAKGRTVLGEAQAPREGASQGFYCSGFINKTNKQTKQTKLKIGEANQPVNLWTMPYCPGFIQTNKQTNAYLSWACSVFRAVFVLTAGPFWVKLKIHE